jgi:hypothetical protein
VWNGSRRAALRAAFSSVRQPWVAATGEAVERALDRYGREWVAMHDDACEATYLRHEQSAELLDLRMACLSDACSRSEL